MYHIWRFNFTFLKKNVYSWLYEYEINYQSDNRSMCITAFFQQSFDHVDRGHLYEIWYTCLRLSEVCISHYQDVVLLCVYAGMVRCVLSRHSERSCLCSGLWHLLFRQLWDVKTMRQQILETRYDGNINLILFLHTFTSLHPSLFLLPFICYTSVCLFPAFFLCWFISLMFLNTSLLFLQCLMHLM